MSFLLPCHFPSLTNLCVRDLIPCHPYISIPTSLLHFCGYIPQMLYVVPVHVQFSPFLPFISSLSAGGSSDQEAGETGAKTAGGATAHRRGVPTGEREKTQ